MGVSPGWEARDVGWSPLCWVCSSSSAASLSHLWCLDGGQALHPVLSALWVTWRLKHKRSCVLIALTWPSFLSKTEEFKKKKKL